jgi:hypothetical protein
LLEGEAVFSDDRWWGSLGFDNPEEFARARREFDPHSDRTEGALANLDERFIHHLVDGSQQAATALAERRWHKAVASSDDPAQRVALSMRVLERALPVSRAAGGSLRDSCERYLMDEWSSDALADDLRDAAWYSLGMFRRSGMSQADHNTLFASVFPSKGDLSFDFRVRTLIERLPDMVNAVPEFTMQHRMLRDAAAAVADAERVLGRLSAHDSEFRRLLARGIRQRNAVVHGAATVPAVVGTCEPFMVGLSARIVAEGIAAASESQDVLRRLERARAAWLRQRESLRRGSRPEHVVGAGSLLDEPPPDDA